MHKELAGQTFGRLIVVKRVGRDRLNYATFLCKCECGNEKIVRSADLKSGNVRSCGCLAIDVAIEKAIRMGKKNKTHGLSYTKFAKVYAGMRARCTNPKEAAYRRYGGRGIKCLWNSVAEFARDMYPSYVDFIKKHPNDIQIDRRDNDGNYSKENCRWVTRAQNARNRRTNIQVSFRGESKCLLDWAAQTGIPPGTIHRRLKRGMSVEKALFTPCRSKKQKKMKYEHCKYCQRRFRLYKYPL